MLPAVCFQLLKKTKLKRMLKRTLFLIFIITPFPLLSQSGSIKKLLALPALKHASISVSIIDAADGRPVMAYDSEKSLIPASTLKLVTSAAALELLGPGYTFKTSLGYTGSIKNGLLSGDIIIKGGGDPSLGSEYFEHHYGDFIADWITDIRKLGIVSIDGRIIADDSYYDYLPVPAKWLWEDAGNYYGAGAYGLSVYDNTYKIHFNTTDTLNPKITGIFPVESSIELTNRLIASGDTDEGYVFAAPYSKSGWMTGAIPINRKNFVLKASVTDPPLLLAKIIDVNLKNEGIKISGNPTTARILSEPLPGQVRIIAETKSPALRDIIRVLNHSSVNLYAEHLTKELGKVFRSSGTTSSGIEIIKEFLSVAGVSPEGMFIEDGSGLSPLNAVNSKEMTRLLYYMRNKGKYFPDYLDSFADAGKEGTLRFYFKDPVFDSRVKAKGGSMKGVRSFAGYVKTLSGKELIFCIIINHYSGSASDIITGIEDIIKEYILNY